MPNPNLPINLKKNTYIGARYVPKFSDTPGSEWDNSIHYEPLTIVLYQGNSYTSKTFVPVGVDINNSTYWAETGNYNSQMEMYRKDVIALQKTVEQLNQSFKNFSEPCAIIIGDSYATEYEKDGVTVKPWSSMIQEYLPKIKWKGVFAQSGAGFGAGSGSDPYTNYTELATRAVNGVSDVDKEKVNMIICNGGSNDIRYERSLIRSGIDRFVNILNTNFPNATIHFFFTNLIATGTGSMVTLTGTVYPYYTQIMGYSGVAVYQDLWKTIHSGYFMASDLSHPNTTGQENLARGIASAIKGKLMLTRLGEMHEFEGCMTGRSWLESDGIHIEIWSTRNSVSNFTINNTWKKLGTTTEAYVFKTLATNYFKTNVSIQNESGWVKKLVQVYIDKKITGVNAAGVGTFTNDVYIKLDNDVETSGAGSAITGITDVNFFESHVVLPFYP